MRSRLWLALLALSRILPNGRLVEVAPTHCPAGHRLDRDTVLVGWLPCDCRGMPDKGAPGHRTYLCQARLPDGSVCGQELRRPACES